MGNNCTCLQITFCCNNFEILFSEYEWIAMCYYFLCNLYKNIKPVLDHYPDLFEVFHLLCNTIFRYQMNQVRYNEELIKPVAERKMNFYGQSTFHVTMETANMVSSSPENIVDSSASSITIQGMRGIPDSRNFDADTYFCMVRKYRKMSIDEMKGYVPAKVSSSFMDHMIGLNIWRCMLGENTISWPKKSFSSKENIWNTEVFEQCLAELK